MRLKSHFLLPPLWSTSRSFGMLGMGQGQAQNIGRRQLQFLRRGPLEMRRVNNHFVVAASALLAFFTAAAVFFRDSVPFGKSCKISLGNYRGPQYRNEQTLSTTCLVESKWMRLMQHSVSLAGAKSAVVTDWLFIEYHDRINVLVEDWESYEDDQQRFRVFRQRKYAYDGESYAIVGGIIEPGEAAQTAAQREVQEEMGVQCTNLVQLGRYRTDVNRGLGWVHSFLATGCEQVSNKEVNAADVTRSESQEVGGADSEIQATISLTLKQLHGAVRSGRFIEVQWSNTVSQALLYLISEDQKVL